MPTSCSPNASPEIVAVPRMVPGVALWKRISSLPRRATIGTPRARTVNPRYVPPAIVPTGAATPVVRLIVMSPLMPPTVTMT